MTPSVSRQSAKRQTAHQTKQAAANTANAYSPSVPISVYRELAAEFQATKVTLDSVTAQNRQLAGQNQQLRQEIERIVQLSLHLQQVANAYQPLPLNAGNAQESSALPTAAEFAFTTTGQSVTGLGLSSGTSTARSSAVPRQSEQSAASVAKKVIAKDHLDPLHPEKLHTEQPLASSSKSDEKSRSADFSGWWLAVAIILIISSAFGAGFLVVRSLLPSR